MQADFIPPKPPRSFRITIQLNSRAPRLDNVLLNALKEQKEDLNLRNITRLRLKNLFTAGKIQIKGQNARPSSALAKGTTYIDVLN
jgi:hypothetical protein